jgi:hypothetical protein
MRRSHKSKIAWASRLVRGRENARLERAMECAAEIRDTRQVASGLLWDRSGTLSVVSVFHDTGRRTVEVCIERRGGKRQIRRAVRSPGLAALVLECWGFGRRSPRNG